MKKDIQTNTEKNNYQGDVPNTPLRFLWYITRNHKIWGGVAFLAMIIAETIGVYALYIISRLIDEFSTETDPILQIEILAYWGLIFVVLSASEKLIWRLSGVSGVRWLIEFHQAGYNDIYRYLARHSHSYFSDRFAGALSNKVSNAVDKTTDIAEALLWRFGPEVISLIVTAGFFFLIHWSLGLLFITILSIVLTGNALALKYRRPYVVTYAKSSSKARGDGVDVISNISAVRQYATHSFELAKLASVFLDRANKDKVQSYIGEIIMLVNTLVAIVLTAAMLYIMYTLLRNGEASAGSLVLVLSLLARVSYTFAHIGNMLNGFIRSYGEAEEGLQEILVNHEIVDARDATTLCAASGQIHWNNVSFEYGANKVFDNFNLIIKPGQRVGLVGPSGAGKSTFVSLLLRQHEVHGGAIEIDGQNIALITQDSLRENIAVVPQEPALFHRTIRENIAYGKASATDEEIIAVAKKAQAHEFIEALELGYHTLVGERGIKLSGGQKQRVAIARAMLKDAPILVLDEATSALDSESEVAIQTALHVLMEDKTVIAIAHRLSTLREMDRILVLEGGKIVEDGPHDTLAKAGGTYQRLWDHQAGGFVGE